jgi:hypothetical protein
MTTYHEDHLEALVIDIPRVLELGFVSGLDSCPIDSNAELNAFKVVASYERIAASSAFFASDTENEAGQGDVLKLGSFGGPSVKQSDVDLNGWFPSTRATFEIPSKGSSTVTSFPC